MSYKQKLRKIQAITKGFPKLQEYFMQHIQKPPKTRLQYLIRKFISFF